MAKHAIDRARYFFVPRTSGRRQLALGRLLVKRKPADSSFELEQAAEALGAVITTITQAYVDRHLEASASNPAAEADLDTFVDGLWLVLRERVDHWQVFQRNGARRLAAKQGNGFNYAARITQAELAARLREQLLGDAGLDFTRLSYAEQSEHMITLWKVIEQEDLGDTLAKLIGMDFYEALHESQSDYVKMVEDRAAREEGSSVNLRNLALELQRVIQNYLIALLAMIRDDDDENVAMIRVALRPMDALKHQLDRERSRSRNKDSGDEQEPAEVAELLAEEQALDELFGQDDNPEPPAILDEV